MIPFFLTTENDEVNSVTKIRLRKVVVHLAAVVLNFIG